jgi:membrane-bound lytic murein transglycosylase MltF
MSTEHPSRLLRLVLWAGAFPLVVTGCGRNAPVSPSPSPPAAAPVASPILPPVEETPEPAPEATPLPNGLAPLIKPFKGDLDGMRTRRLVRVLTVQNPVLYSVDRGREVGMTYEAMKALEKQLNQTAGGLGKTIYVVAIPVARDELIPRLLKGEGDIIAGLFTVTPERQKLVDFSDPLATGVQEVLVTGPSAPAMASLDDLSGQEIYVRPSSSYAEHLRKLNGRFQKEGKAPVKIVAAPEVLEDGDILEMVSAGLAPATVTDTPIADLYVQVFPTLKKNSDIVSPPVQVAWAFRKGSPKLAAAVNAFVKTNKQGTLAGNIVINKYLKTTKWVKEAVSDADRKRFESMVAIFKKYADQYDFDVLLMAAQGYQESGLDQSKRSRVGAVGVMQVMPKTARDPSINIPDITRLEPNIHAGIKYNRWVVDNFFNDPGLDRLNRELLAFASYNAGPGAVKRLRAQAKAQDLNPNKWFNNVELVAARQIGRETVTYVSNIYKYYLAYQMMLHRDAERDAAMSKAAKKKG